MLYTNHHGKREKKIEEENHPTKRKREIMEVKINNKRNPISKLWSTKLGII